jgi:hypothetical protein
MEKTNDGGPAFPQAQCERCGVDHEAHTDTDAGMSLRDYFAAKAMQALIARGSERKDPYTDIADHAGRFADAMLAERAK